MTQQRRTCFQGEVQDLVWPLAENILETREADAAAKQWDGLPTAPQHMASATKDGDREKRRHLEKQLLLEDSNTNNLGDVLRGQTPLLRREMFRRRLFPIRFEESAKNVEEVQQLLKQRQPVSQLLISLLYLAALLLFLSYALEITKIFEAADGITSPLKSALAPTLSSFNSISYEVAKAQQTPLAPTLVSVTPDSGYPADILTLKSKGGVASWIVYGFIPILYGPSAHTSNLGSARIVGHCFRFTFRQVCGAVVETRGADCWKRTSSAVAAHLLFSP